MSMEWSRGECVLVLGNIMRVENCHGYVADAEPVNKTMGEVGTTLVVDVAQTL